MKSFSSLLLILVFSSFCFAQSNVQTKKQSHQKSLSPDLQVLASNLRSDTVDILKYTINLNITDFTGKTISGNTQVKFTPKMNGVTKLDLDLLMLTIDSIKTGGVNLTSNYDDTLLQVNLPTTYNVNDTGVVTVYYHGMPQGDASGWGGFYFQSGYAYNLGVGFAALPHNYGRVWFPCFDNFVERSSFEFNITTNAGKIAYCNGTLASDTTDGSGNRTRKWVLDNQIPSYLASVTVAAYTQINDSYNGINGTIPIIIAALPADTTNVKAAFINLHLALSTWENHFGAYEWNRVGYCMVPFSSGAMEHATNISYPVAVTGASYGTMYQSIMAHELSHHWFGDLATCRTAEDMWLNEGWAHYCEFLFDEALTGYNTYLSDVRVNHETNLQFNTPKEGLFALSNTPQAYTYGDHVYNGGADVAHTLRTYMGSDSLFYYSLKTYLAQNHYKDVSSTDFMNALTAASGINMTDFFHDWVFNPGWCHFSIDSSVVVPSGSNYNVTVYVKQKLTETTNYFTNVPLEMTFKAADWTEQTQKFIMSGANGTFNFTVPFNPVFIAVNMGEKISHAVAPDIKKMKVTGNYTCSNAKMVISVLSISDSAFVRVEHNFTAPDPFKTYFRPYRLSPNHYWKVDGIVPAGFRAQATLNYEGRTLSFTGNYWLDNNLINTYEDSLVLMYRKNAAADWQVYPYYSKNMLASDNDKHGIITIDSLQLGEYVFAMMDQSMGIENHTLNSVQTSLKVFPNPAKDLVTVDIASSLGKTPPNSVLVITDASGKTIYKEKIMQQSTVNINTSAYSNGVYFIDLKTKDTITAKNKFVIAH